METTCVRAGLERGRIMLHLTEKEQGLTRRKVTDVEGRPFTGRGKANRQCSDRDPPCLKEGQQKASEVW